jgi:multidrug resistance efflux pump
MPVSRFSSMVPVISILLPLGSLPAPGAAGAEPAQEGPAAGATSFKVKRGPFRLTFKAEGIFVPAQGTEMAYWPEAYQQGELRVVEVSEHGARVHKGDVVLRLNDEGIRASLRDAEWNAQATEAQLEVEQAKLKNYEDDSRHDLAEAEKALAFAEKDLAGYLEVDRPLSKEEYESSEKSYVNSIEDQEDEIAQLAKMYKEDELTEETEEIVLKRAKRNLEQTKERLSLSQRRHRFGEEFQEPEKRHSVESAVVAKARALRSLRLTIETGRRLAKIDLAKAEQRVRDARRNIEELGRDLEHFTFRTPHDGVVLHGDFLDVRADEDLKAKAIRRGDTILPYRTLITVAQPGALKARFSVKAADRHRLAAGMAATLVAAALPEKSIAASLEALADFPAPDDTWRASALFGQDDPRLLPLLKCQVVLVLADEPDALTVPSAALVQNGDRWLSYVRDGSPFGISPRTVVPGPSDGKVTVIRQGLREGEDVLIKEPQP